MLASAHERLLDVRVVVDVGDVPSVVADEPPAGERTRLSWRPGVISVWPGAGDGRAGQFFTGGVPRCK
jgi:hypothetical protein